MNRPTICGTEASHRS